MRRAIAIRHIAFEDLGNFTSPIEYAGFTLSYVDAGVDDLTVAELRDADLLFILGGPIGANDDTKFPFLSDELKLLERRIMAGRATMGICLGAQLIARAAGARVYKGAREIGVTPLQDVVVSSDWDALEPFMDEPNAFHWHTDTFDLPENAVRLASTSRCTNQAFGLGNHTIAFQFHPEIDPPRIEQWLVGHSVELANSNVPPQTIRQHMIEFGQDLRAKGARVIENYLSGLGSEQPFTTKRSIRRQRGGKSGQPGTSRKESKMITQFMLTKNDVTIADGLEVYRKLATQLTPAELSYVGFKNVGLPDADLEKLGWAIKDDGRNVVIEIVGGTTAEDEINAAVMAKRIGAACLIGGENVEAVLKVIGPSPVRYFPAVGNITKEAGKMHGVVEEIAAQAARYEALGVDGIMLLAYRFVGDVPALLKAVREATKLQIVCAGSVDSKARIRELDDAGMWAFTIGSAVLDDLMTEEKGLKAQLRYVLSAADATRVAA